MGKNVTIYFRFFLSVHQRTTFLFSLALVFRVGPEAAGETYAEVESNSDNLKIS